MLHIRPRCRKRIRHAAADGDDARLDPTTRLHFEHALVAEVDGEVVGVGQIKHHPGCQELGSLVVLPEYRRQGIAAQLIAALEAEAERPLYLICCISHMEAVLCPLRLPEHRLSGNACFLQAENGCLPPLIAAVRAADPRVMRKDLRCGKQGERSSSSLPRPQSRW